MFFFALLNVPISGNLNAVKTNKLSIGADDLITINQYKLYESETEGGQCVSWASRYTQLNLKFNTHFSRVINNAN